MVDNGMLRGDERGGSTGVCESVEVGARVVDVDCDDWSTGGFEVDFRFFLC